MYLLNFYEFFLVWTNKPKVCFDCKESGHSNEVYFNSLFI